MDYIVLVLTLVTVGLVLLLLKRQSPEDIKALTERIKLWEAGQERLERSLRDEISRNREDMLSSAKELRQEVGTALHQMNDSLSRRLAESLQGQLAQLDTFSRQLQLLGQANEERLGKLNQTVAAQLQALQADNSQKLEQMRATVDEKLNATLATRLDNSFKQVGDQLQLLYKSLGEMQALAGGVNDLNRVLSNVKARGTWGEVQLGSLLEQTMSADQYEKNVAVKRGSDSRVEYAVKLPGRDDGKQCIWLPIDAKFAQEDYLKLLDAAERVDAQAVEEAAKALENRVKQDARTIRDKYIVPPATTDFAIMFLPTEGLYAEILRRPGLAEYCQTVCRVMLAGPTTLTALLNSLRMGFATLAIEKKSSEVWKLLRAIKSQYSTFNELLDKSLKKITEAQTSMENVRSRSELINKRLGKVEELDMADAKRVLGLEDAQEVS